MMVRIKCYLKEILRDRFLTESELSSLTGIPVSRISEYCTEKRVPSLLNAKKIAVEFNDLYVDDIWKIIRDE